MDEFDVGCFVAESKNRIDSMTDAEVDLIVRRFGALSISEIAHITGLSSAGVGLICKRAESKLRGKFNDWAD